MYWAYVFLINCFFITAIMDILIGLQWIRKSTWANGIFYGVASVSLAGDGPSWIIIVTKAAG